MERYDNWVIGFSNDERDYILNGDVKIPELETLDDIYFSYNQGKQEKTKSDCTLYWPITSVSNLMNYKFSDQEIMEIVALSRSRGKTDTSGWYINQGVNALHDRWNQKFPGNPIMYWQTDRWSDLYYDAMDKKHFVVVGINYNSDFYTKVRTKGFFKDDNLIGRKTGGHCLCNTKGGDDYKKAVDNYSYNDLKGYSETKEPHPDNEFKIYNNVFHGNVYQNSGFIFLPKPKDEDEIKRLTSMKELLIESILSNKDEWHRISKHMELTNDQTYIAQLLDMQNDLHRANNAHRDKLSTVLTMLNEDKENYKHLY